MPSAILSLFRAIECYSDPTEYPKRGPDESSDKPFGCAIRSFFFIYPVGSCALYFFGICYAPSGVIKRCLGAPMLQPHKSIPSALVPRFGILWSVLTTSNKIPQSEALGSWSHRVDQCRQFGIYSPKDSTRQTEDRGIHLGNGAECR